MSSIRRLFRRPATPTPTRTRNKLERHFDSRLESLEDRTLLSTTPIFVNNDWEMVAEGTMVDPDGAGTTYGPVMLGVEAFSSIQDGINYFDANINNSILVIAGSNAGETYGGDYSIYRDLTIQGVYNDGDSLEPLTSGTIQTNRITITGGAQLGASTAGISATDVRINRIGSTPSQGTRFGDAVKLARADGFSTIRVTGPSNLGAQGQYVNEDGDVAIIDRNVTLIGFGVTAPEVEGIRLTNGAQLVSTTGLSSPVVTVDRVDPGAPGAGTRLSDAYALVQNDGQLNIGQGTWAESLTDNKSLTINLENLVTTQSVVLSPTSTLNLLLAGNPGSGQFDRLAVNGAIEPNGATLGIDVSGYNPTIGDSFTIVNNDGSDLIDSTFDGLSEGATLSIGGLPFVISYAGGTGNDITLTLQNPTEVWVNDLWQIDDDNGDSGLSVGDVVSSTGGDTPVSDLIFGYNAWANINPAIGAVVSGGTVNVLAGTYMEDVVVNKTITLSGQDADETFLYGVPQVEDAAIATIRVVASNAIIQGFTISREGNNPTEWNMPGNALNSAGLAIQGLSTSGIVVQENRFVGNRTAIDLNNVNGHTIQRNLIEDNHTGIIMRNAVTNTLITENFITNNRTAGVLWLDASISTIEDSTGTAVTGNNISGNWYAQIENRSPDNDVKNFSGNWFGTTTPTFTTSTGGEPGYADLIPVSYGGTAEPPASPQDHVKSTNLSLIDATPWLASGADLDPVTPGFQGDFSHVIVSAQAGQSGASGRIQEALDLLEDGNLTGGDRLVQVLSGSYAEQVVVSTSATLRGAPGDSNIIGPDASAPVLEGSSFNEGIGFHLSPGIDDVTIEGFVIQNFDSATDAEGVGVGVRASNSTSDSNENITIRDNSFIGNGFAAVWTDNDGESLFIDWDVSYNDIQIDTDANSDRLNGIYLTNASDSVVSNNTIQGGKMAVRIQAFASGSNSVNASGLTIADNDISTTDGFNLVVQVSASSPASAILQGLSISENVLTSNWQSIRGLAAGGELLDVSITENEISLVGSSFNGPGGGEVGAVYLSRVEGTSTFSQNHIAIDGDGADRVQHGLELDLSDSGTWTIDDNVIENVSTLIDADGTGSSGIRLNLESDSVVVTRNTVTDFDLGVAILKGSVQVGGSLAESNTLSNNVVGVLVSGAQSSAVIENNTGIGNNEVGVVVNVGSADIFGNTLQNNSNAAIEINAGGEANIQGNSISGSMTGIRVFSGAFATIGGSSINSIIGSGSGSIGIRVSEALSEAIIEDNSVSGVETGILVSDSAVADLIDNLINGSGSGTGIRLSGGNADILGNTIVSVSTGLDLDASSSASVSNNSLSIEAGGVGIDVDNSSIELSVGTNTISNGAVGIRLSGPSANLISEMFGSLILSGQTGDYITLANGAEDDQVLDASGVTFDGLLPSAMTHAQRVAVTNRITDAVDDPSLGLVTIVDNVVFANALDTYALAATATASFNDYTVLANAVGAVVGAYAATPAAWTILLTGVFDWTGTEPNAYASWLLGNDGVDGTGDDYSLLVPGGINDLTITANNLGDATIQGPGDVAELNLEGVFYFPGGSNAAADNQNLTLSNLQIYDFDLAIGIFNSSAGINAYSGTTITNNHIRVPVDLNATVAPADVNQNIGIHYSFGDNQTISNNIIDIDGTGISDSTNLLYSSSVGIQSNTSGSAYEGLLITGNQVRVLGAQNADPSTILGIWENGHAHTKNITVSNNSFINLDPGNDPSLNLQRAFRVTSHSSAGSTVTYTNNTVEGANIGFQWLAGANFAGRLPVVMADNTLSQVATGLLIQSNGSAILTGTSLTNTGDMAGVGTGIEVAAGSSAVIDGSVDENSISGFATGVLAAGSVSVNDNDASIHGNSVGIDVTGSAQISNNHIYDNAIGVRYRNGGTGSILGNNFDDATDNGVDVHLTDTAGTVTIGTGNAFAADTYYLINQTGDAFDLSSNGTTFDGVDSGSLDPTNPSDRDQLFAISDKIVDGVDVAGYGLVRINANNVFVTPDSYYAPGGTNSALIQRGIDSADINDTVWIDSGTYVESVNLNKKVALIGEGSDVSDTVIAPSGGNALTITASGTSDSDRVLVQNLRTSGGVRGIQVQADHVELLGVVATGASSTAVEVAGTRVDLHIENSTLSDSNVGFRMGTASSLDGLTILDSTIDGNILGIFVAANNPLTSQLNNVLISGTTFSNNTQKGAYIEKLSNATIENSTFTDNGTDTGWSSNAGLDINLKYGAFANITLTGLTFTGNGIGADQAGEIGYGLTVKARNDAPYNAPPASLTGLTLSDITIDADSGLGTVIGLSLGNNIDLSSVSLSEIELSGAGSVGFDIYGATPGQTLDLGNTIFASDLAGYILNTTAGTTVDGTGATYGGIAGGAGLSTADGFAISDKILDNVDVSTFGKVILKSGHVFVTPNSFFAPITTTPSIQRGVNAADGGDTLHIQAGNYAERVDVNKPLTIMGANAGVAGTGTRGAESVLTGRFDLLSTADGTVIDGMTLVDGLLHLGSVSAIYVAAGSDGNILRNNILQGPGTFTNQRGIETASGATTGLTVEDNLFTGWATGTYVNPVLAGVNISGNTYTANNVGVSIDGPNGAIVSDNTFDGNLYEGLGVGPGSVTPTISVSDNTFVNAPVGAAYVGLYIAGFELDASDNTFDGFNPSTGSIPADLASYFAVQDRLNDSLFSGNNVFGAGLIRISPGVVFVTQQAASNQAGAIQRGIDAATSGDTAWVQDGLYTETATVNKPLTLRGDALPTITAPAGSGQKLLTVTAPNVTIDGFELIVNRPDAAAGIYAANSANFNGLVIENNTIRSVGTGSTLTTPYGNTGAAGIAILGGGGAIESVTIRNNTVEATADPDGPGPLTASVFSRGIWLREVEAIIGGASSSDGNTVIATTQDLLFQFASGGTSTIQNNTFNGSGVDLTEPNQNGSTIVNVVENLFAPVVHTFSQSLLIKHNYAGVPIHVTENVFTGHTTGLYIGGSKDVTVTGNTFTPAAGLSNFSNVYVNTGWPGTILGPFVPVSATIQGNIFNGAAGSTGQSVHFATNLNPGSGYSAITLGGAGALANLFTDTEPGSQFVRLSTQGQPTTLDLDASENLFTLPGGVSRASELDPTTPADLADLFALEDRITHAVDVGSLGFVETNPGYVFVTPSSFSNPDTASPLIQRGIDAADIDETVYVQAGTYSESPTINKSIDLIGEGSATTVIDLLHPGSPGAGSLGSFRITGAGNNVLVQGFTIRGKDDTGSGATTNISLGLGLGTVTINQNRIEVGQIGSGPTFDRGIGILTTKTLVPANNVGVLNVTNNEIVPVSTQGDRPFYINPGVTTFNFTNNAVTGKFAKKGITQANDGLLAYNVIDGQGQAGAQGLGTWGESNPSVFAQGTVIEHNTFTGLADALGIFDSNDVQIRNNRFDSVNNAIQFLDYGTASDASTNVVVNNSFTNISGLAIDNADTGTVVAEGNWFGSLRGPTTAANPGGNGAAVGTGVDFTPWIGVFTNSTPGGEPGFVPTAITPYAVPTKLVFTTQPSATATQGDPFAQQPVVTAVDDDGVLGINFDVDVTGAQVALTLNQLVGSGNLSGVSTVDAQDGVATFAGLSIDSAGIYTLTATDSGFALNLADDTSDSITIDFPAPTLGTIQPDRIAVNHPGFTLTLTGTGFYPSSVVMWDPDQAGPAPAQALSTTYVSPTELTATVPGSLLTTISTADVSVENGTPGGGTSNALSFQILATPTVVFVDDSWASEPLGEAVTIGLNTYYIGYDAFASIQSGVNAVAAAGTVNVLDGTYNGLVTVNKSITLNGANTGIAAGVDGGARGNESIVADGFYLTASNVIIDGFLIQDGNSPLGISGVSLASGVTDTTVANSILSGSGSGQGVLSTFNGGNDTLTILNNEIRDWTSGVYNQSNDGVVILGNYIHGNVAGVGNDQVANVTIQNNRISGNAEGVGQSGGVNGSVDITIFENDLSGNTTAVAHYSGDPINAAGNWFGVTDNASVAALIQGLANVDISPYLASGTDISAAEGFQAEFAAVHASNSGAQIGGGARIQEAIALATGASPTVYINAGSYAETVNANQNGLSLIGFGGTPTIQPTGGPASAIAISANNVTLENLTVNGSGLGANSAAITNTTAISDLTLDTVTVTGGTSVGIRITDAYGAVNDVSFDSLQVLSNLGGGIQFLAQNGNGIANVSVSNSALTSNRVSALSIIGNVSDVEVTASTFNWGSPGGITQGVVLSGTNLAGANSPSDIDLSNNAFNGYSPVSPAYAITLTDPTNNFKSVNNVTALNLTMDTFNVGTNPIYVNNRVFDKNDDPILGLVTLSAITSQIVDDSTPSQFSTIGSWGSSTLGGYNSTSLFANATPPSIAQWSFNVTPGTTYRVMASYPSFANSASNALFIVKDGGIGRIGARLNQQLSPNDTIADGASWEHIGDLTASSSSLVVELSNESVDGVIRADAIRIVQIVTPPPSANIVDNTSPSGFATVGTWPSSSLPGYNGSSTYSAPGGGGNTATWTFNVTPGRVYTVMASYPAHPNSATNAPFTVLDGATPKVTRLVNQRQAASDINAEGLNWKLLGTVSVSGGSLVVRLTNNADGNVRADAIRIVEVQPLSVNASFAAPLTGDVVSIDTATLQLHAHTAIDAWARAGLDARSLQAMRDVQFVVTDLPGQMLGVGAPGLVLIDNDAAGFGWSLLSTPALGSRFGVGSVVAQAQSIDLLTVLAHELGHVVGLDDLDPTAHAGNLMAATINPGERRLPTAADVQSVWNTSSPASESVARVDPVTEAVENLYDQSIFRSIVRQDRIRQKAALMALSFQTEANRKALPGDSLSTSRGRRWF